MNEEEGTLRDEVQDIIGALAVISSTLELQGELVQLLRVHERGRWPPRLRPYRPPSRRR